MQFKNQPNTGLISERFQHTNITALTGYLGGIDRSDVPYIYHHLRKGCILKLSVISGIASRQLMFEVTYGSHRLGILSSTMARKIQHLQSRGKIYRLTIAEVVKEKYMPPTAIMVELESETDFLDKVA